MDIVFRSQLTLLPRTDLSITSNIRNSLQEIFIHFNLNNVSQFRLSFLRSLLFSFSSQFDGLSGPWKCRDRKFVGISSPYSYLWLKCFPVAKMPKAQWERDRNMDTKMEISVVHGQLLLLYQWELLQTKETALLSTSSTFTRYKHSPTSGFLIII